MTPPTMPGSAPGAKRRVVDSARGIVVSLKHGMNGIDVHRDASGYGRTQRLAETVTVAAWALATLALLVRLTPHVMTMPHVLAVAVLLGWVAADLVSGVVHWLADTYGSAETPIVGPTLIYGFREHHNDPQKMLRHDFVETNGATATAALPVVLCALAIPDDSAGVLFAKTFLATLTLAVVLTNQLHKWAHMPRVPAPVALLQRLRLVLRAEEHARHHTAPFRTHYCITTGWLNGPLARWRVFERIERVVAAVGRREGQSAGG